VFLDTVQDVIYSPYKHYLFARLEKFMGDEARKIGFVKWYDICKPLECVEEGLPECVLAKKLFAKCEGFGVYRELEGFLMEYVEVDGKRVRRWVYLLGYPADTRIGYNNTSLIVHSILTSAYAWIIAYMDKHDGLEALLYALAGLLHDIGKPIDPRNHVEKGIEFIENVLGDVLKKAIGETLYSTLLKIIEQHHGEDVTITEADRLAASERSTVLVMEYLRDDLKKVLENMEKGIREPDLKEFVGKAKADPELLYRYIEKYGYSQQAWRDLVWRTWIKLYEDYYHDMLEINEKYGDRLWSSTETVIGEYSFSGKERYIKFLSIDIRGIQKIINGSKDLRIMAVSSYLIDLWLMSILHNKINEFLLSRYDTYLPLSSIILASGGSSLIAIPNYSNLVNELKERIMNQFSKIDELGLDLEVVAVDVDYTPSYIDLYKSIVNKMDVEKHIRSSKERIIHPGLGARCDLCGLKPASYIITRYGEAAEVCQECYIRWKIGSELIYFKHKMSSRIDGEEIGQIIRKIRFDGSGEMVEEDLLNKYWIEVIAGMPPDPSLHGRILNYSILNIDGNLMGYYMSLSKSFTEAVEKSYRIDYSMKIALRRFAELIKESIEEAVKLLGVEDTEAELREVARYVLGIMYAGGDDAKIASPSYLAIPLALHLAKTFHEELGCTTSVSIGIASGPPKHCVWGLNDASHELMEISKKQVGRKQASMNMRGVRKLGFGAINIYSTETTSMLTGERVLEYYSSVGELAKEALRIDRPEVGEHDNLSYILNRVLELNASDTEDLVRELIKIGYRAIMYSCMSLDETNRNKCIEYYLASPVVSDLEALRRKIEESIARLKKAKDRIRELIAIYDKYRDLQLGLQATILYSMKRREEYRELIDILVKTLEKHPSSGEKAPLINIMMIIDIISGGAI